MRPRRSMLESRRIVVGGLDVHTWVAGEGMPVVLVHGYGVSGRYMLPLAQSLAHRFSVFAPDLPGYGRSQRPRTPARHRRSGRRARGLAGRGRSSSVPRSSRTRWAVRSSRELAVRLPGRVGPMVLDRPDRRSAAAAARHQLLEWAA